MIKIICDICETETKDVSGEFNSVEVDIMRPSEEPRVSKYVMCMGCTRDLKRKVVELIQSKKDVK